MPNKKPINAKSKKEATQRDRFGLILKQLAVDLTPEDKKAAEKLFSRNTIASYCNGEVKNNATAVYLIKFFREVINKRELEVA